MAKPPSTDYQTVSRPSTSRDDARMSSERLKVEIDGQYFCFQRPADLETLWEAMDDNQHDADDRIPYWVEIWPSSILLAEWIRQNAFRLRGRRCLDLGCGLGLCASVAAGQAHVLGVDYQWSALAYARQSAVDNGVPEISWLQMDWRHPGIKPHSLSFIWGAEIVYERRFFQPLLELFEHSLAPNGCIWLASPERAVSRPFWERLAERRWRAERLRKKRIDYRDYSMEVALWEVRRADGPRPLLNRP